LSLLLSFAWSRAVFTTKAVKVHRVCVCSVRSKISVEKFAVFILKSPVRDEIFAQHNKFLQRSRLDNNEIHNLGGVLEHQIILRPYGTYFYAVLLSFYQYFVPIGTGLKCNNSIPVVNVLDSEPIGIGSINF